MQNFFTHLRTNIFRGIFAIIPVLLCVIALELLYHLIDKRILAFLNQYIDTKHIPGLGLLILLFILFLIGYIVTNVMGRRILKMFDRITARIPFIREIYLLTRQISDVLGKKGGDVYKKTVLVNYPNANQWSIAFLAGKVKDQTSGKDWYKVYIPMAHPVIGFVYLAEEKSLIDPGWSVQDGFKMVISLGLIVPKAENGFKAFPIQ